MSKLFEDSSSENEANIRTNNSYARNYDNWRQKEELNKFKTKYGEQSLNDSGSCTSSSSDDDDDEAVQITEELEKNFFKTLASLKTKDPKIYDENVKFFAEKADVNTKSSKDRHQPMYIKDFERKLLLEKGGHVDESDDEVDEPKSIAYMEEQEKKYWKGVLATADDDNEEWGSMFKTRTKTVIEMATEEEDYKQWLLGQKEDIKDEIKNDLKPLKDYWSDPKLDNSEKFLRDYILNKRFMESEDNDYIPTYEEIIHDSDEGLSEDEKQLENQEEFEHKYNYRFEEPDEEFIKRYPRTIQSSLRRQDDRRKIKRAETKERKQKEKEIKMEEVKQMQAMRKNEIAEKIKKLKEITGNTQIGFDDNDIDGDFNPEDHDRRMQNLFNEEFYQGQEEEQKPAFPEELVEDLGVENWDHYQSQHNNTNNEVHCEDDDFNMDCDYEPGATKTSEPSKGKKKRRRKTKFAEVVSELRPTFNPEDKTYKEYLDEYYKLECEDIVGDIPCRYKYRKVIPNSFGLSVEEIFSANDRELNRWCSLKKAVQYRQDNVEKYDVIAFSKKAQNQPLKRKLLPSLYKVDNVSDTAFGKKTSNSDSVTKEKQGGQGMKNSKGKKLKTDSLKNNYEDNEGNNLVGNSNTRLKSYSNVEAKNKNEATSSSSLLTEIRESNCTDDIDNEKKNVITNNDSVTKETQGGRGTKNSKGKKLKTDILKNNYEEDEDNSVSNSNTNLESYSNGEATSKNEAMLSTNSDSVTKEKQSGQRMKNRKSKKLKTDIVKNNYMEGEDNSVVDNSNTSKNEAPSSISLLTEITESNRKDDIDDEKKNIITNKTKKKKKKKSKSKSATMSACDTSPGTNNKDSISNVANNSNDLSQNKKQKRKNKNLNNAELKSKTNNKFSKDKKELDISDARLKAFGIKPKKFKNKIKYGQKKNKEQNSK